MISEATQQQRNERAYVRKLPRLKLFRGIIAGQRFQSIWLNELRSDEKAVECCLDALRSLDSERREEAESKQNNLRASVSYLTLADLDAAENGVLQAIRSQYKGAYFEGKVSFAASWSAPMSEQNVSREAQVYLETFDIWTKGWTPPKNISLSMVRLLLEKWASYYEAAA